MIDAPFCNAVSQIQNFCSFFKGKIKWIDQMSHNQAPFVKN